MSAGPPPAGPCDQSETVTAFRGPRARAVHTRDSTRSRRAAAGRPRGAISAIVIGAIGVLCSVLLLVTFAVLWNQLSAYSRCMQSAITLAAQQDCQSQLTRSVDAETSRLRSAR